MSGDIPQWAIRRAEELRVGSEFIHDTFARYIAAHEEPPVDPLLIEAREIVARFYDTKEGLRHRAKLFRDGDYDNKPECVQALMALRRGMELSKEPAP